MSAQCLPLAFRCLFFLTNSTPAKSSSLGFVQLSFMRLCPSVPVGVATAGAVLSPAMVVLLLVLSVLRTPITLTARTAARYALPTISPLKVTFCNLAANFLAGCCYPASA